MLTLSAVYILNSRSGIDRLVAAHIRVITSFGLELMYCLLEFVHACFE